VFLTATILELSPLNQKIEVKEGSIFWFRGHLHVCHITLKRISSAGRGDPVNGAIA